MSNKRIRFWQRSLDNDIKFSGPLSYRYLRIIAWVCLGIGAIGVGISIGAGIGSLYGPKDYGESFSKFKIIINLFTLLPLPLFLLANFSQIIEQRSSFKRLLAGYAIIAFAFFIGYIILVYHSLVSFYGRLAFGNAYSHFWESRNAIQQLFRDTYSGVYAFNVFLDLLIYSFIAFFLMYEPKKYFQGKWIILFRLLVILPIIYEYGCVLIKYNVTYNGWNVPFEIIPLLVNKSPIFLLAFIAIIGTFKIRQRIFMRKNPDKEKYEEYLKTNANSLHFSCFTSIIFALCSVVDFILYIVIAIFMYMEVDQRGGVGDASIIIQRLQTLGFGNSICLLLAIPFIMLFNYHKTHEDNGIIDKAIPLGGIVLVVLVVFETINLCLINAPIRPQDPSSSSSIINDIYTHNLRIRDLYLLVEK